MQEAEQLKEREWRRKSDLIDLDRAKIDIFLRERRLEPVPTARPPENDPASSYWGVCELREIVA